MAAPIPHQEVSIEADDIHSRLQKFMEVDGEPVEQQDSLPQRPPAKRPPQPPAEGPEIAEDVAGEPEEESSEEIAAAPDAEEGEPDDGTSISTLSELAKEFSVDEEVLVNSLQIEGPRGPVTLKEVIQSYKLHPETMDRWHQIDSAEERLIEMDKHLQQKSADEARNLAAHTQVVIEMINSEYANVNWDMLEREEPTSYLILKQKQAAQYQKVAAAVDALKRMEADRDGTMAVASDTQRKREMEVLHRKMPDWREPDKARTAMVDVQNFLVQSGFNQDEINSLVDHRFLLVAYQAAKFHQLQTQAPQKIEKLKRLPSTRGALKSSARSVGERNVAQKQHDVVVSRLKQSGSERDAAKLMEALL